MRLRYDTTECGRCLGSGEYSYNQRDGKKCWGCGGSGKVYTKAAQKSRQAVDDLLDEMTVVHASTIAVGDRVQTSGMRGYATVTQVEHKTAEESGSSSNGVPHPTVSLTYETKTGLRGHTWPADQEWATVRVAPTPEQIAQVVALAETLPAVQVID